VKVFNLPNFLTLTRLILSPLMLPVLLVFLLRYNFFWLNCVLAALFGLFSLTDFFDGYLARKLDQETIAGRILDPIADKFLTYSTLVALLAANKIFFYWVVLLIGREFFMMGLRTVALEHNFSIHVSLLGKLKTIVQMVCLTFIILNPYQSQGFTGDAFTWNVVENLLIFFTLISSIYSAKQYYHDFIRKLNLQEESGSASMQTNHDED